MAGSALILRNTMLVEVETSHTHSLYGRHLINRSVTLLPTRQDDSIRRTHSVNGSDDLGDDPALVPRIRR